MSEALKRHYYLASALLVFQTKVDGELKEDLNTLTMNTVMPVEQNFITAADLGKTQQSLQIQLHKRMEGVEVVVLDVLFNGISYLGEMTKEEFYGAGVTQAASNG